MVNGAVLGEATDVVIREGGLAFVAGDADAQAKRRRVRSVEYATECGREGWRSGGSNPSYDRRCNPKPSMTHVQLRLVMYTKHAVLCTSGGSDYTVKTD